MNDDNVKNKIEPADKDKLTNAVEDTLRWLDSNQFAEKEEFEAKQKEVEAIAHPIMTKVYQSQPSPDFNAQGGQAPPEVD